LVLFCGCGGGGGKLGRMLTLLVAADISGEKYNMEVQFPAPPSVQELEAVITKTYLDQFGLGKFAIGRVQVYDEVLQRWAELTGPSQLKDFCQLYAFNRNSVEVQKPIPPPVRPAKPVLTTHEDKAAQVFDDLDAHGNKALSQEDLRRGFTLLRFGFSQATVDDLFSKADQNRDGEISFAEWQRFTEVYPTMLDALYFRCRDYWEAYRMQEDIKKAEADEAIKAGECKKADEALIEAKAKTQEWEGKLQGSTHDLTRAQEDEQKANATLAQAQRQVESAMRDRKQKLQKLESAREKERQIAQACADAQRDIDGAQQRGAWQEAEETKQKDKKRQTECNLQEVQKAKERIEEALVTANREMHDMKAAEATAAQVLERAQRETSDKADALNLAESNLQQKAAAEREGSLRVQEAAAVTERERAARDDEERKLQMSRERAQHANVLQMEAERAVAEMKRRVAEQVEAIKSARERRAAIEDREAPLIEKEVKLREQRDALEEKEARLRNEASSFLSVRGSTAPAGSPYRPSVSGPSPVAALRGY